MYEVEAKVPISKSEYARLETELNKIAKKIGKSEKRDSYYGDPKIAHIRKRDIGAKSFFVIKSKAREKGIESNLELEWQILDKKKFAKLAKVSGLVPTIRKSKRSMTYKLKNFLIELNYIAQLGHYLEIERVVTKKSDIAKAKKELIQLFAKLGYNQTQFEKKYYLELLAEKR